jgi:hypothetical protein
MTHIDLVAMMAKVLTEHKPNATYLEMGVSMGGTFNVVAPMFKEAWAVDIDRSTEAYISHNKNLRFFLGTTDEFIMGSLGLKFDLVFIDANHQHENSLRDFIGIAPNVNDNGFILLHDTYPIDREHILPHFSGDSYKTAWYIRRHLREDFEIVTIPYYHGLSIIRKARRQVMWADDLL